MDRKREAQKLVEAYELKERLEEEDPELLEALKSIFTVGDAPEQKACPVCGVMLSASRIPSLHYKYAYNREQEDGVPKGQKPHPEHAPEDW